MTERKLIVIFCKTTVCFAVEQNDYMETKHFYGLQ